MKKIFWTSIFWLVVFFGFILSLPMFDVNLKARVTDWLGVTTITTSGETIPTTGTTEVMSGIITIQTTLADMQIKLDTLLGSGAIPVVTPTSLLASGTVSDTATATVKTSPITK